MTRSTLPPGSEAPESTVAALHALYHQAASAEPDPMLDRSILDAARAELKADRAANSRRPTPWWKRWLPVASALAVALVGLSVTWRVMDEQEHHLREEMRAAEAAAGTVGRAAPGERPAQVRAPLDVPASAMKSRSAESAGVKDSPFDRIEPAATPAPAAPAALAPVLAEEATKKGLRAESEDLRERRDAAEAASSVASPSPARATGKLEARSPGVAAGGVNAADAVVQAAVDAATPELWLKHIRELRAAGRSAEAAQSLARFRARYPDFVLPDDLLNPK